MTEPIQANSSPLNQAAKRLLGKEAFPDSLYLIQLAQLALEKRLLTHTAMEGNEGAMEFAIEKLQREKPEDAMEMLVSPDDPDEVRLTPEDLDGASLEDGALLVAELIHQLLIEERD